MSYNKKVVIKFIEYFSFLNHVISMFGFIAGFIAGVMITLSIFYLLISYYLLGPSSSDKVDYIPRPSYSRPFNIENGNPEHCVWLNTIIRQIFAKYRSDSQFTVKASLSFLNTLVADTNTLPEYIVIQKKY